MRTPRLTPRTLGARTAALAAVLAAAVCAAAGSLGASGAAGDCTPGSSWPAERGDLAGAVLGLLNEHRQSLGLRPLSGSSSLEASAAWKARHMAAYRYLGHDDPAPPVARGVSARLAACGYPVSSSGWGENVAAGYRTAASVMAGWLGSAGHRANIENPSFTVVGIGAAADASGAVYWVQDFGTAGGSGPPPGTTTTATTTTATTTTSTTTAAPPATTSSQTTTTAPGTGGAAPPTTTAAKPAAPAPAQRAAARTRRTLPVGRLVAAGRRPHAGRPFTARLQLGFAPRTRGGVGCRASIRGRTLRVVVNVARRGGAVCRWRVPAGTRGRVLFATVGIRAEGAKARRSLRLRVL